MIPQRFDAYETPPAVLLIAPYCDPDDVGEAYCAYHWVKAIAARANVTLLTMTRPKSRVHQALPNVTVLSVPEPAIYRRVERLNAMAKLSYPTFYRWAKATIKSLRADGAHFDVAHQLSPFSMRYPSPLRHFDIPYVLGPMAGGLPTPKGFRKACKGDAWYMRLRGIDPIRRAFDPALRHSFKKASLILGAAPYVRDMLHSMPLKRFDVISELGMDRLPERPGAEKKIAHRPTIDQPLRLLHVGRGVRTKGLADVLAALARLPRDMHIHLDVAGRGLEIDKAAEMVMAAGLMDRVTIHGQIPREAVDQLYEQADVFCFPSFREPSGSVVFEALSHSLPIIVADAGGPAHVVTEGCGLKIKPGTPDQYAADIAAAIERFYHAPAFRQALGDGARRRMANLALWHHKMEHLFSHYRSIIKQSAPQTIAEPPTQMETVA